MDFEKMPRKGVLPVCAHESEALCSCGDSVTIEDGVDVDPTLGGYRARCAYTCTLSVTGCVSLRDLRCVVTRATDNYPNSVMANNSSR